MYILSQVFSFISALLYVISMLQKNKFKLVIYNFISNIFFIIHYLLLDGLSGAYIVIVASVFLVTIYLLEKYNKEKHKIWITIVAIILSIIITVLTWAGPMSLFPLFSIIIYYLGMIFKNTIFVKTGSFFSVAFTAVYLFLLKSYVGLVNEIVLMISAIVGIILDIRKNKKEKNHIIETKS